MDGPNLTVTNPGSHFTEDGGIVQVKAASVAELKRRPHIQTSGANCTRQSGTTSVELQKEAAVLTERLRGKRTLSMLFRNNQIQSSTFKA